MREEEEKESLCLVQIQLLWVCISYASCCRDQKSGRDQCKGEKDEGVVCRDGEGRVTRLLTVSAGARGSRPADQEANRVRTVEWGRKPQGFPHPRDPVQFARLHS